MKDKRYSEEDVKRWEQLSIVSSVFTTSHFDAWLYYRDKRRDKRVNTELLDRIAVRIKLEMIETYPENESGMKTPTPFAHFSYEGVCDIVDKIIAEMKAEVEE